METNVLNINLLNYMCVACSKILYSIY